jgi:hypothetical protein
MSGAESREILEACLARAQSLAAALTEYAWADRVSSADIPHGLPRFHA